MKKLSFRRHFTVQNLPIPDPQFIYCNLEVLLSCDIFPSLFLLTNYPKHLDNKNIQIIL